VNQRTRPARFRWHAWLTPRLGRPRPAVARALLGSQYALMLEYRAEIALWALSGLLPFIMLALWSQAPAAAALGLSGAQLGHYFLSAYLVRQFSVVAVSLKKKEDALVGRLSPYLLQPLHPLWRYVAAHLAPFCWPGWRRCWRSQSASCCRA